jgi:uncharacterized protein
MGSAWRECLACVIERQARPVEKYGHQPRLYALTRAIGEGLVYDDDVVFAAAWLHDLGVFTGHRPEEAEALSRWDHVVYAVAEAPGILAECGFPVEKVAAVVECIAHHQPKDEPLTMESTILREADMLEQLGAVGILRTVCKVGRDTRFHTFTDAVKALERAVETLPGMMRLATTRALAEERVRVHREWLEAVRLEAGQMLF